MNALLLTQHHEKDENCLSIIVNDVIEQQRVERVNNLSKMVLSIEIWKEKNDPILFKLNTYVKANDYVPFDLVRKILRF